MAEAGLFEKKLRGMPEASNKGFAGANLIGIFRKMEALINEIKTQHNAENVASHTSNNLVAGADIDLDALSKG